MRNIVTAYLATGRRRSELLALTWEDVDLEGKKYFVGKSKTHLSSWYPINAAFAAVLEGTGGERRGKIFKRWVHADSVSKVVKEVLTNAGYEHMRLHDLRHSFASLYLMNGGDTRSLMELMGHTHITTTQIYSHLTKQHLLSEADRVNFGIVTNE